jgi:hypothetical protein
MITPRHLTGTALLICWALLLAARTIAAAIYSTAPGQPYEMGLYHIGWTILVCAWSSLALGLFLLLGQSRSLSVPTHATLRSEPAHT